MSLLKPFGTKPRPTPPPAGELGSSYPELRNHVLRQFANAEVGKEPFYHSYIEGIFPEDFYRSLLEHMLSLKHGAKHDARTQDNAAFVTDRHNLVECADLPVRQLRHLRRSGGQTNDLVEVLPHAVRRVDCELAHSRGVRIHLLRGKPLPKHSRRHPPKVTSFVFYLPEREVSEEEELKNATVLYDKNLEPKYGARFRANSVCTFVSHFYSYHGFSSITERDVLVMFYVHEGEMEQWRKLRERDLPPFDGVLDAIAAKIRRHPLREYGDSEERLVLERAACRINAPKGRVMRG